MGLRREGQGAGVRFNTSRLTAKVGVSPRATATKSRVMPILKLDIND
jgi:hypothetical protein